jgi:hypothetical protein
MSATTPNKNYPLANPATSQIEGIERLNEALAMVDGDIVQITADITSGLEAYSTQFEIGLGGKADLNHNHTASQITDFAPEVTSIARQEVQTIIGMAPAALDTFEEIAAKLYDQDDAVSALTLQISEKSPTGHGHTVADISDFDSAVGIFIAGVRGNAPALLDTIEKLSDAIGNDPTFASTIGTALDGKAALNHSHNWAEIQNKPSTFPPAAHAHSWSNINDKPSTFPPASHSHSWPDITGKPTTFPPDNHNHDDRYYTEIEVDAIIDGLPKAFGSCFYSHTSVPASNQGMDGDVAVRFSTAYAMGYYNGTAFFASNKDLVAETTTHYQGYDDTMYLYGPKTNGVWPAAGSGWTAIVNSIGGFPGLNNTQYAIPANAKGVVLFAMTAEESSGSAARIGVDLRLPNGSWIADVAKTSTTAGRHKFLLYYLDMDEVFRDASGDAGRPTHIRAGGVITNGYNSLRIYYHT